MGRAVYTREQIDWFLANGDDGRSADISGDWLNLPACGSCSRYPESFTTGWKCRKARLDVDPRSPQCVLFEPRSDGSIVEPRGKHLDLHVDDYRERVRVALELKRIEKEQGVVYFVDCGEYTKIGHTAYTAARRIKGLMGANPFEICLWATVPGNTKTEGYFHKELNRYKHRLEWFRLTPKAKQKAIALIERMGGSFHDERYS